MKKNYEKFLPTYICDIQEINNLSKVMFMSNFPHHQFILCTSGTGKICSDPDIHSAGYDILSICSKIFYEGGDDRCREGMSGKRN